MKTKKLRTAAQVKDFKQKSNNFLDIFVCDATSQIAKHKTLKNGKQTAFHNTLSQLHKSYKR